MSLCASRKEQQLTYVNLPRIWPISTYELKQSWLPRSPKTQDFLGPGSKENPYQHLEKQYGLSNIFCFLSEANHVAWHMNID